MDIVSQILTRRIIMLICLLGNIASGKSEVAKTLSKELMKSKEKKIKVLQLDEYRKKFNKYKSLDGETQAQLALIAELSKHKNVILECSGLGKWYHTYLKAYRSSFETEKVLEIKLCSPRRVLEQRISQRFKKKYKWPPLPQVWNSWFHTDVANPESNVLKSMVWMERALDSIFVDLEIDTSNTTPLKVADHIKKYCT